MPQLGDASDTYSFRRPNVPAYATRFWNRFCDFALRDNVLEVALGLIIAASFSKVVTSFVADILTPLISLLPFIDKQFGEKFAILRAGPNVTDEGYNTITQALDDGAVILAYGSFFNKIFDFMTIALTLYAIASLYTWASHDPIIHETVKCKFCRKRINVKAKRCIECTSWLDGREQ